MINKRVAIINSTAPFSSLSGKESQDIALIFGSYEQEVSLFFQGEGVRQLVAEQLPELINVKNYLKTFAALEFYDIENVYICHDSLKERQLNHNFCVDGSCILSPVDFSIKLHEHQIILRF